MYLDKENLYSEDQTLTATTVSTNVIDHTITEIGPGEQVEVVVQVTEDFDAGTVQATLQTDSDEAFGSAVDLVSSAAVAAADLVAGYQFALSTLPQHIQEHTRLNYTVTGAPTTGRVTAGLALNRMAP